MIRSLRAFLWMRWRIGMNSLRARNRRDTLEQLSRAIATLLPVLAAIVLLPSALVLATLGFIAGRTMGDNGSAHLLGGAASVGVRVGLLVVLFGVLIGPFVRLGHGAGRNVTRLLLLPIRRGALHLVEVLSGLGDVWLALVASGTLALPVGLAFAGALLPALIALLAAAGLLATLTLIGATLAFAMGLLFRKRSRAEWLTIVGMSIFVLAMVSLVLLDDWDDRPGAEPEAASQSTPAPPIDERFDRRMPWWTRALPTELFVFAVIDGVERRAGTATLALGGIALWVGFLYWMSRRLYFTLLETPEEGGTGRGPRREVWRVRRLPGLDPAASAVAVAHFRLALRTVRGKLAVFLNFVVIGMIYSLLLRQNFDLELPEELGMGMLIAVAGFVFSMLSLQPMLFNHYAVDRAGLTLQFLAPLSDRDLVRGKLLAGGLLTALSTGLCALTGLVLEPGGSPLLWLSLVPLTLSTWLLIAPLAAILSAALPKTADLSKLGKQGNPHGMAAMLATLMTPLLLSPPLLLGAIGVFVLHSTGWAALLITGWTALAVPVSVALSRLAVTTLRQRRETLLLVANGR